MSEYTIDLTELIQRMFGGPTQSTTQTATPSPSPSPTTAPTQQRVEGTYFYIRRSSSDVNYDRALVELFDEMVRRYIRSGLEWKCPSKIAIDVVDSYQYAAGTAMAKDCGYIYVTWRRDSDHNAKLAAHEVAHVFQSFYLVDWSLPGTWVAEALAEAMAHYITGQSSFCSAYSLVASQDPTKTSDINTWYAFCGLFYPYFQYGFSKIVKAVLSKPPGVAPTKENIYNIISSAIGQTAQQPTPQPTPSQTTTGEGGEYTIDLSQLLANLFSSGGTTTQTPSPTQTAPTYTAGRQECSAGMCMGVTECRGYGGTCVGSCSLGCCCAISAQPTPTQTPSPTQTAPTYTTTPQPTSGGGEYTIDLTQLLQQLFGGGGTTTPTPTQTPTQTGVWPTPTYTSWWGPSPTPTQTQYQQPQCPAGTSLLTPDACLEAGGSCVVSVGGGCCCLPRQGGGDRTAVRSEKIEKVVESVTQVIPLMILVEVVKAFRS